MQGTDERREFQRLRVEPPIPARFADAAVMLIEIGVLGARIRHHGALARNEDELRFTFDGGEIALQCVIVRTTPQEDESGTFESGIRFRAAVGDSGDRLRAMLAALVAAALDARRSGTLDDAAVVDGDKTIRGSAAAYVSYRLDSGIWKKRAVFLPEQPATGFTVARSVDAEEVQRLQRVYQGSDDEGRRLIRLFAELSISEAMQIPPRA